MVLCWKVGAGRWKEEPQVNTSVNYAARHVGCLAGAGDMVGLRQLRTDGLSLPSA